MNHESVQENRFKVYPMLLPSLFVNCSRNFGMEEAYEGMPELSRAQQMAGKSERVVKYSEEAFEMAWNYSFNIKPV